MIQFTKQRWMLIGASAYAAASTCSAPLHAAEAGAPVAAVPGLAAGWPVTLRGAVIGAPVAADLDGDGKLEVVASAEGDGVVTEGLSGFAPPCLADLDGDGKAEILALSGDGRSVAAFRGNGRPFLSTAIAAAADDPEARKPRHGFLAWLPLGNTGGNCGVAAVDLGGDGVMDIFAGTQWIRLAKDGATRATDMVPPELRLQKNPIPPHLRAAVNAKRAKEGRPPLVIEAPASWSNEGGCSVVDIDGDGLAEVLFGLSDGRLFVYRTGMSLKARDAQWPTLSGSFQHTGTWTRAK